MKNKINNGDHIIHVEERGKRAQGLNQEQEEEEKEEVGFKGEDDAGGGDRVIIILGAPPNKKQNIKVKYRVFQINGPGLRKNRLFDTGCMITT